MTGLTVQTRGLAVGYGKTAVLSDVDLDLGANRIHGLLGRNAAGKSTLLGAIASLRLPQSGTIRLGGQDPFENASVMEATSLIRESGDVLADEKLSDNLDWLERMRPTFDRDFAERLLADFGLDPSGKPQELSRGQQSAFGVVVGLANRTPLTMFDEVHLGMDAPARQRFYDTLLEDFVEHPRTFIISTHLISEVEHLLETVTILRQGTVLLSEEADDLRTRGATITGKATSIDAFTAHSGQVLSSRDLGPTRQVTLFGDLDEEALRQARGHDLEVGPVPLQDLFIHLTDTTHQEAS